MVGILAESAAAASDPAEAIGYGVGLLIVPVVGLVLLIVGLVQWSKSQNQRPSVPGPYGPQQGYPQPGQPYYPPPPGYAPQGFPAPAPKRRGVGLMIAGAIVLVLGIVGGVGVAATKVVERGGGGLAVGECISDTAYEKNDISVESIACDEENALFQVAAKVDADATCPDGKLQDSGYAVLLSSRTAVCFVPNLRRGSCYSVDVEGNNFHPVDCGSTEGLVVHVDDVVDGTTDVSECAVPEAGLAFPEPARVLCLGPAG